MQNVTSEKKNISLLRDLHPEDVWRMAFEESQLSFPEICKILDIQEPLGRRILSNEKYYPSYADIPKICSILNNTLVIDWLYANTQENVSYQDMSCKALERSSLELGAHFARVCAMLGDATESGSLEKSEMRLLLKILMPLSLRVNNMIARLRAVEKRVARHG